MLTNRTKMEKKLNTKIEQYSTTFKNGIRDKINELGFQQESTKINALLEFVYDYERFQFSKEDFIKRKRVKNSIPCLNRCSAKRSNGEQCTRRRKESCEFCGTHSKGTPHGLINVDTSNQQTVQKMDVFVVNIKGIAYYLDNFSNVYSTEDILDGKQNPRVVAKYTKENENYKLNFII